MAVALNEDSARRRAEDFARIRDAIETAGSPGPPHATRRELTLQDFIPNRNAAGITDITRSVGAFGTLSKEPVNVPAGVAVSATSAESVVASQPETLGDTWIDAASARDESTCFQLLDQAAGRVIAHDIVVRWWHDARHRDRPQKLGFDGMSDAYRETAEALAKRELVCASYLFAVGRPVVLTVLSRADGTESTFGLAAGAAQDAAGEESLSEALQGRVALSWPEYPPMDPLAFARLITGWVAGSRKVLQLRDASSAGGSQPQVSALDSWSEMAELRFDHEPLVVQWLTGDGSSAGRVLCPGANVYERTDAPSLMTLR